MPRLKREDWFSATIPLLKDKGIEGITIDLLCSDVKRSKGSFYHHFKDMKTFQRDFLEWWYEKYTEVIIDTVEQELSPADKMEKLEEYGRKADLGIEIAIRIWAHYDPLPAEYIKRVDQRRLSYLVSIYDEFISDNQLAHDFATFDYAAFIGFLMLGYYTPAKSIEKLIDYNRMFNEAMLRLVQHRKLLRPGINLGKWEELLM